MNEDIEVRVKQRNLALNDYIVLKLEDMEILHASPVRRVNGEVRKQPEVDIQCGDYGLHILDRYVLFHFLKSIDTDLKYVDFNRFLDHFDLKSMIEDFIESAPGMSMPVWVLGDEITAVDDGAWDSNSKYLLTIHDELFEYYHPNTVYVRTVDMGTKKRPAICIERKDRIVEIVCDQQRTHITLRIKAGEGFVQPRRMCTFQGWIHLIESESLYDEINSALEYAVFTKAHAQARVDGTEVLSPSRGRANTIPFYPRNKIEREDYFQLSQ
tara:strand:- start:5454 stop:6260 length:807 start_codon:yes stop_codon:yes gene_type:complete